MADDTVKRRSVSGRRDSRGSFKAGSGFDQYRIENREGHEEHPRINPSGVHGEEEGGCDVKE
jgi:hypothetical protein